MFGAGKNIPWHPHGVLGFQIQELRHPVESKLVDQCERAVDFGFLDLEAEVPVREEARPRSQLSVDDTL